MRDDHKSLVHTLRNKARKLESIYLELLPVLEADHLAFWHIDHAAQALKDEANELEQLQS